MMGNIGCYWTKENYRFQTIELLRSSRIDFNPLMSGGLEKVIHTETNLKLSVVGLSMYDHFLKVLIEESVILFLFHFFLRARAWT